MFSFLISLAALVVGYILYGKFVERRFGADPTRKTPAITKADGVDYIPMPAWKVYMIQFLNIAGTGPILVTWEPSSARQPTCGLFWAAFSPVQCTTI